MDLDLDLSGRVTMPELQHLVTYIEKLVVRAQGNGQQWLSMALSLAADSVADNVEVSMDWDDVDAG